MDLRVLRYFLAVAEEGNITRAAEKLFLTQPTLSKQLMQLEDELGAPLLIRGTRRVELTDAGRILRRRAAELLAMAERTREEVVRRDEAARLYDAISKLTPIQRRRVMMLLEDMNCWQIAKAEGRDPSVIYRSVEKSFLRLRILLKG